jgi:hypothetical protein
VSTLSIMPYSMASLGFIHLLRDSSRITCDKKHRQQKQTYEHEPVLHTIRGAHPHHHQITKLSHSINAIGPAWRSPCEAADPYCR